MVERDRNAAWATIATATMDKADREKAFGDWSAYARACNIDPWLRYHSKASKQEYLLSFAARVRTGIFGRAIQVGHQSVEKALRYVAQTLVMAGFEDPRKTPGSEDLDLPFRHLLLGYRNADPAPQPQLAIPVNTIEEAGRHFGAASDKLRAAADLVTTAFFFLLRVGEYTLSKKRGRTVPFRVQDVSFRRQDGSVIPNTAPLDQLMAAASVTLFLENQKNGQRGATILHTACPTWFCPVKALARRVSSIIGLGMQPSTPLSFVRPGVHIVPKNITNLIKFAARTTNLVAQGYDLKRVGTHSLRASGAMALKLQGASDSLIMKIGRWSGLTFLTYIHAQIGALNVGLAQRMATRIHFVNVCAVPG
jgi:hypothetical protein